MLNSRNDTTTPRHTTTPHLNIKEMILAACIAASLTAWIAQPAKAASDAECEKYAWSAVRHHGINLAEGCGLTGFRWHAWRDGHYQWCKGVSKSRVRSEVARRANAIDQCQSGF